MRVFLVALVVLGFSSSHCYVKKGNDDDEKTSDPPAREREPEDMNKVLEDLSKYLLGGDDKLVEEIVQELNEEMSDSSKELLDNMKKQFLASLSRRKTEGGELYRDARREDLLKSLYTAFVETDGGVDTEAIADITRKVQEKEQQRRRKAQQFESNRVKEQYDSNSQTPAKK